MPKKSQEVFDIQLEAGIICKAVGAAAAVGVGCYMTLFEQFDIRVREFEMAFSNLPTAFDGYTILHLSDLHLTKLGRLEKRTMEIIEAREVDTCVVTGDITQDPRASDVFRRVCSVIKHRDPLFAILGNSEHKPWVSTSILKEALTFDGLNMLVNSSSRITRDGQSIAVVGVDDAYSRLADVDAAFAGVDPEDFIIYLTHCPSTTPQGIARGADLTLAGHTHGGQVRIPRLNLFWTHMRANRRLNDGLYTPDKLRRVLKTDVGESTLFVNRGVGTSRLHIRLCCPPEIVYIVLRKA
ncbi:MAG: metallophosphoesterase [Armatimonadota bacterium]|nr:metallophosphoesterase [bacterium]